MATLIVGDSERAAQLRDRADDTCEVRANMIELHKGAKIGNLCGKSADAVTSDVIVLSAIREARAADDPRAIFQLAQTSERDGVPADARFTFDTRAYESIERVTAHARRAITLPAYVCVEQTGEQPPRAMTALVPQVAHNAYPNPTMFFIGDVARRNFVVVQQIKVLVTAQTRYFIGREPTKRSAIMREVQRGAGAVTARVEMHRAVYGPTREGLGDRFRREIGFVSWFVADAVHVDECAPPPPYAAAPAPSEQAACPPHVEDGRDTCSMVHPRHPERTCAEPRAPGSVYCARHTALVALI